MWEILHKKIDLIQICLQIKHLNLAFSLVAAIEKDLKIKEFLIFFGDHLVFFGILLRQFIEHGHHYVHVCKEHKLNSLIHIISYQCIQDKK